MKKIDLLHTTILIIGLMAGYSALEFTFYALSTIVAGRNLYHISDETSNLATYYGAMIVMKGIACVVLIKNARTYARQLLKDEPEASWEDAPKLQLNRRNIVFILILGMGLYTMIQSVPYAANECYELFKTKISNQAFPTINPARTNLLVELLKITAGAFLIYAAPNLTEIIDKRVGAQFKEEAD